MSSGFTVRDSSRVRQPSRPQPVAMHEHSFLVGGGEVGCLIQRLSWSTTSIGQLEVWPACLKTTVAMMLRSNVAMVMLWGTDVDLSLEPLRDSADAIIGVIAQGHDVTDRVNAERALSAREAQFRFLAEALPNHVWITSPDGILTWANSRAHDYAGVADKTLLNDGWASITGGPKVTPPTRRGFGSLLLQRVFATDFNGQVQIDYHPAGVVCVLQSAVPTIGGHAE